MSRCMVANENKESLNKCNTVRYGSIDLVKLVMAILVVAIHTRPFYYCDSFLVKEVYGFIVRCAVPFFFLSSGFLLAKKMDGVEHRTDVLQNHLKKIIRLYLLWTVIYLPLTIYGYVTAQESIKTAIVQFIINISLVGENFNSWMLWYLLSTVYSLVFIILLRKIHIHLAVIAILGAAIFLGWPMMIHSEWLTIESPRILSAVVTALRNATGNGRVFTGLFYIPLGMLLGNRKEQPLMGALLLVGGCVGYFVFGECYKTLFIAAYSMGVFVLTASIRVKDARIYLVCREISTIVYLIHMYVWTGYYLLVYQKKNCGWDSFVVVTLVSIAFSLLYIQIKDKRKQRKKDGITAVPRLPE